MMNINMSSIPLGTPVRVVNQALTVSIVHIVHAWYLQAPCSYLHQGLTYTVARYSAAIRPVQMEVRQDKKKNNPNSLERCMHQMTTEFFAI